MQTRVLFNMSVNDKIQAFVLLFFVFLFFFVTLHIDKGFPVWHSFYIHIHTMRFHNVLQQNARSKMLPRSKIMF